MRAGYRGDEDGAEPASVPVSAVLRALRLESVDILQDGNCQFRAFSQQLYGSQDFHRAIRAALVEHMAKESRFFGAMFDEGEGEFEQYLAAMRLPRTWGDELTLRAFSDRYMACVHVVTSTAEHWHLSYEPLGGDVPAKKHVFLTYLSPVHYDALTAADPETPGRGRGGQLVARGGGQRTNFGISFPTTARTAGPSRAVTRAFGSGRAAFGSGYGSTSRIELTLGVRYFWRLA